MRQRTWASLAEISAFCKENGIRSREAYSKARQAGILPFHFPSHPTVTHSTTWAEILWVRLADFSAYCQEFGITGFREYQRRYNSGLLPPDFPPNPRNAYNSTLDMLGWARTDIRACKWIAESQVRRVFERVLGEKFPKRRPRWLIFDGSRLELDGYCRNLNLAFEYQGEYHYAFVEPHHRDKTLESVQTVDAVKLDLCKARGVNLICVPCGLRDKETFVLEELARVGHSDIMARLDFYRANRAQIVRAQLEQEAVEYKRHPRRHEFELSDDEVGGLIDLYGAPGYWDLRTLLEEGGSVVMQNYTTTEIDTVEAMRFIEYLKYLEDHGRSTTRVLVHLTK
jgi:hypothetical protein